MENRHSTLNHAEHSPVLASIDGAYRHFPALYSAFLFAWSAAAVVWAADVRRHRRSQAMNNLLWVLASIPMIKVAQLGLSFIFWYSCFNLQICSLWMSFGVYISGIFFQTASFVSFMIISNGYCIIYEHLPLPDRRITAVLGCAIYMTLIGHRASVPYVTVLLVLNYSVSFYMIFRHISENLFVLREHLRFMEYDETRTMRDAFHTKYKTFKKFQAIMQFAAVVEILVHIDVDEAPDTYWLRLFVREWAQLCIFFYIGWIFRALQCSIHFPFLYTTKTQWKMAVPPMHSIEMDAPTFSGFASQEWHVGVPTSFSSGKFQNIEKPLLIVVQQPSAR